MDLTEEEKKQEQKETVEKKEETTENKMEEKEEEDGFDVGVYGATSTNNKEIDYEKLTKKFGCSPMTP